MPGDEGVTHAQETVDTARKDENVSTVTTEEWSNLARAFKPGLGGASDNLSSNVPPSNDGYTDSLKKSIALQIEKLVEAVLAVKDGRQIQGPDDLLMTPSGALQELYSACRKLFDQERSLQLIDHLTNPPGLVIQTLRVDPNDLETDRNNITRSGTNSRVGATAYFEGSTPPSRSGRGVIIAEKVYQGT